MTGVRGVEHRLEQLKNFAAFVIQWQTKCAGVTQGLAQGVVNSVRQLTQGLEEVGMAVNGVQTRHFAKL